MLKEFVIQCNESRFNAQRVFYERAFNLHETTLKVIISFKKSQVDEELSLKVNRDIEFVREDQ